MGNLDKVEVSLKSGIEQMTLDNKTTGISLLHFWRWYVSDVLSNATRGVFAEFIVATATGIDIEQPREEWSAFDLTTPDGIKLEIKSAAYLQSWTQRELSKISFSIKLSLFWDSITNKQENVAKRHADVYVFCLLHHEDKQTVDPLNLDQWEFYVLATKQLNNYTRSKHSITLKSLKALTSPVSYSRLRDEIRAKHALKVVSIPEIIIPIAPEPIVEDNLPPLPATDLAYIQFKDCDNDSEYFEWMKSNPSGFVINGELNPTTKDYVIHKAGCWHIADEDPRFTYTIDGKLKICSTQLAAVTDWLKWNRPNGGNYRGCGRCKPFSSESQDG